MTDRTIAERILQRLVEIPSISRQEADATHWLAARMDQLGFDRAFVDAAGNAVGELGAADAARTVLLLGHIDTVPGDIPVRVETTEAGRVLYGRGSVDAKGPLATFTAAAARLGSDWARAHDVRLVVVGAVEEEAATSKGARFIADRFDGGDEPIPNACIIGEPSGRQRITLGYKGRLLIELEAAQPMAHTAGPDRGVATVAVDFWNWIAARADAFNGDHKRAFEQLLPSLRDLHTWTDDAMHDRARATVGIRLPLDFDTMAFVSELQQWAAQRVQSTPPRPHAPATAPSLSKGPRLPQGNETQTLTLTGPQTTLDLRLRGHEPAWRSDRSNPLVRAFLAGIRSVSDERPGFVVKTGTSDMNVVGPRWQCPIVAYGPGDSSLDHTPHEHISLDEYWQAILVLEETLRTLVALL